MALPSTPLFQALTRPAQIMGGDRSLVLLIILATMVIGLSSIVIPAWQMIPLALVLGFSGLWAVTTMGKADPLAVTVYLRHIKQQRWYRASPTPWRK